MFGEETQVQIGICTHSAWRMIVAEGVYNFLISFSLFPLPLVPFKYQFFLLLKHSFKMRFHLLLAAIAAAPLASAQLNKLAKEAGLKYFGTALDNPSLNNTKYMSILNDTREFGQLTPANGQKVHFPSPFPKPLPLSERTQLIGK